MSHADGGSNGTAFVPLLIPLPMSDAAEACAARKLVLRRVDEGTGSDRDRVGWQYPEAEALVPVRSTVRVGSASLGELWGDLSLPFSSLRTSLRANSTGAVRRNLRAS